MTHWREQRCLASYRQRQICQSYMYYEISRNCGENNLNKLFVFFCCRVPPDLKSSVYRFGIVTGGQKEWEFAYNQFKSTDVVSDKLILLRAMAGSQEPWIIERQEAGILRAILINSFLEQTNSSV